MSPLETAIAAIAKARTEAEAQYAELVTVVQSAAGQLEHGDRAEASRLLDAAADIEYELTGDCESVVALAKALGLDDEGDDTDG